MFHFALDFDCNSRKTPWRRWHYRYELQLQILRNFCLATTIREQLHLLFVALIANVVDLTIGFEAYDWVYQVIGDELNESDWEEAVRLANLKLAFKINFPNLERLTLKLDSALGQIDQLKPFVGMPSLEGKIFNLSKEGAEFILKTKQ